MHFDCSIVMGSSCSLSGLLLYHSPVVVYFDHGHPCFRNFNSTIPVDVIRVKCYVDIHIRLHPNTCNINRDSGIEIPEAWMAMIKIHNYSRGKTADR